jgi:lysophospholipase L1-like esterase
MSDPETVHPPTTTDPRVVLLSKPALAALVLLAVAFTLEVIPSAERLRLLTRVAPPPAADVALLDPASQHEGSAALVQETRTREELVQPETARLSETKGPIAQAQSPDFEVPKVDAEVPPVALQDERGSLHPFYAALQRTADATPSTPGPLTRIAYFGDSLVASDYVTGTLRRLLQTEFGDGGHGFVLMADAWPSYFHNDVFRFASRGFEVSRIVGPYVSDGLYGLGGVSFLAPPGVRARFGTAEKGDYGRRVSLFRVLYLQQPYGGQLQINLDGQPFARIDTQAETKRSGIFDVPTSDGEHLLEVVTAGRMTRTFGVVLERAGPGVVLDAIGIQGARIRFLDKQDDQHWAEQLQQRNPDLLVYEFGANESGDGFAYSMEDYHETMKAVLLQGQRALPKAGCLVLAAMDRARKEGEGLVTVPIIPHIVRQQEATAKEVGCAFWNTYEAMGGKGSMAKWVRRGLGQADLTHPTGYGAQVIGNWVYQALMQGFNAWRAAP